MLILFSVILFTVLILQWQLCRTQQDFIAEIEQLSSKIKELISSDPTANEKITKIEVLLELAKEQIKHAGENNREDFKAELDVRIILVVLV